MTAKLDVTVCVATYGDLAYWDHLAQRAVRSAEALDVPVVRYHGDTLHGARNAALRGVSSEWVCFLDADDELERRYFEHMARGTADLRAPAVRYVRSPNARPPARVPKVAGHVHACEAECLRWGNFLVIGTLVRTDVLLAVGGFDDYAWSEDWAAFVKCWLTGASVESIPEAVYRAHVRRNSRNRAPSRDSKLEAHRVIARDLGLPVP